MPDLPSENGSGYFPPAATPPAATATGALSQNALSALARLGAAGAPALNTDFTNGILRRFAAVPVPPQGKSGGNGPGGFAPGGRRDASLGISGTTTSAAARPGTWTGIGPYTPPYGTLPGAGGAVTLDPLAAPADGPFVLWQADSRLANGRLFSPLVASATAPASTSSLWLDTSVTPRVIRYHNGTAWVLLNGAVGATGPPGSSGSGGSGAGLVYRGAWSATPATAYAPGDVTTDHGGSYLCIATGGTVAPSSDGDHWGVLALQGRAGASGATGRRIAELSLLGGFTPAATGDDLPSVVRVPVGLDYSFITWTVRAIELQLVTPGSTVSTVDLQYSANFNLSARDTLADITVVAGDYNGGYFDNSVDHITVESGGLFIPVVTAIGTGSALWRLYVVLEEGLDP